MLTLLLLFIIVKFFNTRKLIKTSLKCLELELISNFSIFLNIRENFLIYFQQLTDFKLNWVTLEQEFNLMSSKLGIAYLFFNLIASTDDY
ncbi:hypothetical protein CONCODRAFT_144427 [Conidiobolus coronatus NRRL 28638]|uniref:Uncharacterized protein n=1 Tax=Conidiobolus coronatus (strain ATCC 28846 / CBS 209.66 / NRRL 28638) TaxID=796925 RepID=A0A137PI11_CONC2|nr:hypothetical protein CONCODRAFT_144427 [Conidiobolus coronatus NRRL 28638]|eukprot:KXN74581.1 hypothetical protein CONCODRAFT_144427 [Conidiobolus coronatus NRRL 28638]